MRHLLNVSLLLILLIPISSYSQRSFYKRKHEFRTLTGVVVQADAQYGSSDQIAVQSGSVRYVFFINGRSHQTAIIGGNVRRAGTHVKVSYVDLERSEMDAFYYARAVRITNLSSSSMARRGIRSAATARKWKRKPTT